MGKRLVIIGAGQFGCEIYSWTLDIQSPDWSEVVFIDDNLEQDLLSKGLNVKIISTIEDFQPVVSDVFVCSIGASLVRLRVCKALQNKGANFINLIHPSAVVSKYAKLGVGNIIFPNVYLSFNCRIENFVTLNFCSSVGHDVVVNSGCTLSSHCDLTGSVELGECVFMGTHASILPGVRVGNLVNVGAGSVVARNVPDKTTIFLKPPKRILHDVSIP